MAYDMMKQLEMEIAKRERGRNVDKPWWADVAMESIRQIPEQQERAAKWQEMKNDKTRNLMAMRAGDYQENYSISDLDKRIERFESVMKENQGTFDDYTTEWSQVVLQNMKDQRERNVSFEAMSGQIETESQKMIDTIDSIDRAGIIGQEQIDKIRNSNEGYLKFKSEFFAMHGDRLEKTAFKSIADLLNQGEIMNTHLLVQAKDQNMLTDEEFDSWKTAWESRSLTPMHQYQNKEAQRTDDTRKSLVAFMDANAPQYTMLDNFIKGKGAYTDEAGNTYDQGDFATLAGSSNPEDLNFVAQLQSTWKQLEANLKTSNKNYASLMDGVGHLDGKPGMEKVAIQPTPPKTDSTDSATPKTDPKSGFQTIDIPKEDISKLKVVLDRDYGNKAHDFKIKKEFKKAKNRDANITIEDFMTNRPDLYIAWKDKEDVVVEQDKERLKAGKFSPKELKAIRSDIAKVKNKRLRRSLFEGKGSAPAVQAKLGGETVQFAFGRNEKGRLIVEKQMMNPYTGKWGEFVESSIDEFNSSTDQSTKGWSPLRFGSA